MTGNVYFVGYGLAGLAFLGLALLILVGYRWRAQAGILLVATLVSAAWGFGLAYDAVEPAASAWRVLVLEFAFDAAWLFFIAALLSGSISNSQMWIVRFGGVLVAIAALAIGVGSEIYARRLGSVMDVSGLIVVGSLATSLFGLVGIEQVYRNARSTQLRGLKYLCLGLGSVFGYDLFLYSNATLGGQISEPIWVARGFVVAMSVPLIAVAARRASSWSVGIFVSRQIVFYGATLFGAGVYLLLMGFIGYYIRIRGGEWGPAVQLVFTFAAFLLLAVFLFSDRLRGRLRVFISKHFFENRYDYREEWLRLIDTLTVPEDGLPLRKRGLKALAQIVDASAGLLWLSSPRSSTYECVASWNVPKVDESIPSDASLIQFLQTSGWVIERKEYDRDPSRYETLDLTEVAVLLPQFEFIVPLQHDAELLGFVSLSGVDTSLPLNFEDRDLLKTAGKQIASYLTQEIATEQLAESRQFEAFNKLTAYIMHDLKNLIAQQSLVVENAEKHKDNPEFIDDAINTIRGSVARMRRVIEHLQQRSVEQHSERVELCKLVMQAVSQCDDRRPVPRAIVGDNQVWVRANRERLLMALCHAIRNAQDATPPDGTIAVEVRTDAMECEVSIVDTGRGMDEEFVRERLFRPFDSTKGTSGMGIGAYQIRETLQMAGGRVDVESTPGMGTRMTMVLAVEP